MHWHQTFCKCARSRKRATGILFRAALRWRGFIFALKRLGNDLFPLRRRSKFDWFALIINIGRTAQSAPVWKQFDIILYANQDRCGGSKGIVSNSRLTIFGVRGCMPLFGQKLAIECEICAIPRPFSWYE
jgi:hypothetical protein